MQTSKVFSSTIIRRTNRGSRYNWSEGGFFVRSTAPVNPNDQVWEGDLWYSPADKEMRQAKAVGNIEAGDPITWGAFGGGTSGPVSEVRAQTILFAAGAGNFTFPIPSGAGGQYTASQDVFADLTGFNECRAFGRATTLVSAFLWIRYNLSGLTTNTDLGPILPLQTIEDSFAVGEWFDIPSEAKTWVRLGFWGKTLEAGGESATLRNIGIVCR